MVSYGKTIFGSPEKTLAYRQIGLSATAQEANDVQRSLDVLGRFGWEVITIVGTIGGDQQMVLKRRYDRSRSAGEASEILRGREVYLRDLLDIMEREARMREASASAAEAEKSRPRLIELDSQDASQENARLTAERKASLEAAIAGTPWASRTSLRVYASSGYTSVDVTFDGTQDFLKNGNSYRKSEVASWVKSNPMSALQQASVSFGGLIMLKVTTNITFNGSTTKVDDQSSSYSQSLRRWN